MAKVYELIGLEKEMAIRRAFDKKKKKSTKKVDKAS